MAAESAQNVNRQSMGNQQVRIAVLVVIALVVVGVVLFFVLHKSGKHHPKTVVPYIPPTGFTAKNLAAESKFINTKFFWAGKQGNGYLYEFRRTTNGFLYVRYLTNSSQVGSKGGNFLTIATYPFPGAYKALKKQAGSKAVPGPGGSLIYVRPKDHKSVLMAFPHVNDQIEIYAPSAAVAVSTAESGDIKPVR